MLIQLANGDWINPHHVAAIRTEDGFRGRFNVAVDVAGSGETIIARSYTTPDDADVGKCELAQLVNLKCEGSPYEPRDRVRRV
jgi:hypothetical protein